jgi:ferritin-like metal-binding protein YciE
MKDRIGTIEDAFAFQLQRLYYTENRIKEEFHHCCAHVHSPALKKHVEDYLDETDSKILKLQRVFNYILKEPLPLKNETINRLLHETNEILTLSQSAFLKDLLIINVIKDLNAYKISNYRNVYIYSVELELDTPTDLLQQVLEWELDTSKALSALMLREFNRTPEGQGKVL